MSALLLRRASPGPGTESDLLIVDGRISAGPIPTGAHAIDLGGRPVLPGLADHHVHLLGLAASWASVDLSPIALDEAGGLAGALRAARARRPEGWLRGVGYDVAGSGELDHRALDALDAGPVRIQDRTGIRWILDQRGLDQVLPRDPGEWPDGVERDGAGRPTGVLVRLDGWLRERLDDAPPDLAGVGAWLAGRGITAVTDAGAQNGPAELALLAAARLPQRVVGMARDVEVAGPPGIELGPVKVLLDDDRLPPLDDLAARIDQAHRSGRAVAVHCVTDVQVVLALAAGLDHRDRIEHGTYLPEGLLPALVEAAPTVVVQPGLVATRGDRYLDDHGTDERPALHRLRSLQAVGLRVAAGSDAPYGPADPWTTLAAAVDRRTPSGRVLGPDEGLDPRTALALLTGDPLDPSTPRAVRPGAPADLVILDDGWDRLAHHPDLCATLRAGVPIAGTLPA
ncbi:amidohydrolase family protein [Aquihabitans sp. McL0605]|uniref:amidohydrolase family protein n=1 Tax=Aquihabitans sp. McL0605 TaxID=3415671 RepID=UPI003CE929AE